MNCIQIPTAGQMVKYATLLFLVILLVEQSIGLPSSPKIVNNKLFAHMIRTRSLSQKYCGRHIVKMLSMLCDGNYFSPSKRNNFDEDNKPDHLNNGISPLWDDITPNVEYKKPEKSSDDYFLEPKEALNMFGSETSGADTFTRNRRGIVDECCRKACSIRELSSYCE